MRLVDHRRRLAGLAAAVLGAATCAVLVPAEAVAALPSQCATDVVVGLATCTFTGAPGTSFTVVAPVGTHSAVLHVVGRAGESGSSGSGATPVPGGSAAVVDGVVAVTEGVSLVATFADNGGQGTGGAGDGGGSSIVSIEDSGATSPQGLAEAAGGGGGGAGIGSAGSGGTSLPSTGGAAGQAGGDGAAPSDAAPARGGTPGEANAPGIRGIGAIVPSGDGGYVSFPAGQSGAGSRGGDGGDSPFGGGGGGGGRYGGGGGGAGGAVGEETAYGAGGGGGSSLVPDGGTSSTTKESTGITITFLTDELPPPPPSPSASYSPTALDFGNTPIGTTSPSRSVALTNTGDVPLEIGSVTIHEDAYASFHVAEDGCSSQTLPAGATCEVGVELRPLVRGAVAARLRITDNSTSTPHDVTLSGFGTKPVAVASPSSVTFAPRELGSGNAEAPVSLTNDGDADLHVASVDLPGGSIFTVGSDSCSGATLKPGESCTVTVVFTPTSVANVGAYLVFRHDAGSDTRVFVQGSATPPADLAIRGVGALYTGHDHLVTRVVSAAGRSQTYPVEVTNDDVVSRSYGIHLQAGGAAANAQLRPAGWGPALTPGPDGDFLIGPIGPGETERYSLVVTPTEAGQGPSRVQVVLEGSTGAPIESVTTETNIAAPVHGTTSYELFAKQGSQPFIGGPTSGETTTGPALHVGGSVAYVLRLRNDGAAPTQIGLRLSDVDGCAGAFTTTAAVGTRVVTGDVYAGAFLTRVLSPGAFQDVRVTIRRTSPGCPARLVRAESLHGGTVVRTSYLLANAAYDAAID